jgi:tetratricopeptide (TPR) repeat protein
LEQVTADYARLLGPEYPHTLTTRANLAWSYWQAGRIGEAITILEQVTADRELLGPEHPHTLAARANLATSYRQAGRTGEAITILERVAPPRPARGPLRGHNHWRYRQECSQRGSAKAQAETTAPARTWPTRNMP